MTIESRIVITGLGTITPIGEGKTNFWQGLVQGNVGRRPITLFDTSQFNVCEAGEITDFDPKIYLGMKGLKYLNRTTKLLMSATFLCLEDARIKNHNRDYLYYGPEKMGVAAGTTCGAMHSISSFDREALTQGPRLVSPMAFPNTVLNAPVGHLAIKEDIRGLSVTLSTGYNASFDAIGISLNYLRNNRVDCMIAGGAEELCEELFLSYAGQGLVSEDHFLSEGSVVITLEHLAEATKRGANVYAEIVGYGNTFSPNPEGLTAAVKLALEEATMKAEDIDHIILSTNISQQQKDIEQTALQEIFSSDVPRIDLRPFVGDSYSAGGSMQIGASLRLIEHNLGNIVLNVSLDPAGNNSALIVKDLNDT